MLELVAPPASLQGSVPPLEEQLAALAERELALLGCAVGEHLPVELAERVLDLRARRAALVRALGVEPVL